MLRQSSMIRAAGALAMLQAMGRADGLPVPTFATPARVERQGTPEGEERLAAANEKRLRRQERNKRQQIR